MFTSIALYETVWAYDTSFYEFTSSARFNSRKAISDLFKSKNIFGWFLSIGGRDAEERISRLLEVIPENSFTYKSSFQHLTEHKLGVELLAPRHEKLYFEGTGLSRRLSKRSFEPPLTPEQRERWANVFETLVWNLWCVNAVHPCELQLTERLMI